MEKKRAIKHDGGVEKEGGDEDNPNRRVPGYFYDSPITHYLPALLWLGINTDLGNTKEGWICVCLCVNVFLRLCSEV